MSAWLNDKISAHKRALVLIVLLALAVSGLLTGAFERVTRPLNKSNSVYLDDSFKDTLHLMVPVGLAKAGADLVEGSTINVEAGVVFAKAGMSVEAGDTLQPLLEYIDVAWRLLLISLIYNVAMQSILAGSILLAKPLLIVSLLSYLLSTLLSVWVSDANPFRHFLRRLAPLFLLCALLFALILPLTVAGTAYLSKRTTDIMRNEMWTSFDKIGQVFSMEKFHSADELKDKAVILKDKIVEIGRYSKDSVGDVASSVCRLAAIKLLNGIVFPLATLAFLIWIVRGCLYPALGLSDHPLSPKDFRAIGAWVGAQRETHAKVRPQSDPPQEGTPLK